MSDDEVTFPGAHAPYRQWRIDAGGIGLAAYEWGDPEAPPLLAVHGGFDFARTYDEFAPLLAAAGWRVVSWDQRGHGDTTGPPSTPGRPTSVSPGPSSTRSARASPFPWWATRRAAG